VFFELVIIIPGHSLTHLVQDVTLFDTLRGINKLRPFKLVFLLVELDYDWDARKGLLASALPLEPKELWGEWREAMDSEAAKGGFLDFLDQPTARILRCPPFDWASHLGVRPD